MQLKDSPKAASRRLMRQKLAARDSGAALARAKLAQEFVLADPVWRQAASVGLYVPVRGEIDCGDLAKVALAAGKKLYLPRIVDENAHVMEFAPCSDLSFLRPGPYAIPEPPGDEAAKNLDFVLVPGLAFDLAGTRLGQGFGYYDRWLARGLAKKTLGFCFAFQIRPGLQRDPWDAPVNGVCSEDGLQWL